MILPLSTSLDSPSAISPIQALLSHTENVCTKLLQLCLTLCDPMDCSQAPLSMEFFRQEYWIGLPCPLPGDLPNSKVKPMSPMSPALSGGFFTTVATWKTPILNIPSPQFLPCSICASYDISQSLQFSHSVVSDSFRSHESQHTRPSCLSPTPTIY